MSYQFTEAEQQIIMNAINQCTALEPDLRPGRLGFYKAKEPSLGLNAVPLYQTLSDLIAAKLDGVEQYDDVTKADLKNAKLWLDVAIGANAGAGMHSAFIRAFTKEQYLLRTGNILSEEDLQLSSSAVARNLANSLLGEKSSIIPAWTLPRIDQIASVDAEAIGETLYQPVVDENDTALTRNAGWSGTLGFNLLGGNPPFETWRLTSAGDPGSEFVGQHDQAEPNKLDDFKNLLYAVHSYGKGLWEGFKAGFMEVIAWATPGLNPESNSKKAQWEISLASGNWRGMLKDVAAFSPKIKPIVDFIADIKPENFLDMLKGARQGEMHLGKTTKDNFAANAKEFFDNFTAVKSQTIDTQLLPDSVTQIVNLASQSSDEGASARGAALVAGSFVRVALDNTVANSQALQLYDTTTGTGELILQWLHDRAVFVAVQGTGIPDIGNDQWRADWLPQDKIYEFHYIDGNGQEQVIFAEHTSMATGVHPLVPRQPVFFGSEDADTFDGIASTLGNRFYGGKGYDTYILGEGTGADIIFDSDGQGVVKQGSNTISGIFKPPQEESGPHYYSEDEKYRITDTGQSEWHLFDNSNNTHIAILKHWKDGDLGIQLGEADKEDDTTETVTVYELDFSDKSIWVNTNATGAPKGLLYIGSNKANSVTGSNHKDLIITGEGNNYVMSGGDNDDVVGGSGNNYIRSGSNTSTGDDHDLVQAGTGSDMVYGGAGDDEIWANREEIWNNENKTWVAQPGNGPSAFVTQFDSYQRGDWLSGEDGDDFVVGSHQKDLIFGGAGADILFGGAGNDLILGDAQYAVMSGAMPVPYTLGQTQSWVWDDNYSGFKGPLKQGDYASHPVFVPKGAIHQWDWVLDYEDGFTITLAPGVQWLSQTRVAANGGDDYIDAGDGDDFVDGQTGNDTVHGGAGNDIVHGGEGNDQLHGDDGDDEVYGGPGNDLLSGGKGNDYLNGGDGDDLLHGGEGINILHGGAGNDTYHITGSSTTCMDSGGVDTYVIHWDSLQQGGMATIDDSDGLGHLVFDGWYININTVFATGENEWRIQGDNGQGILIQKGSDLHISAEGANGNVIVQNFFSQDNFLNLTLPEFEPLAQNMFLGNEVPENHQFIDLYQNFYDHSAEDMMIYLTKISQNSVNNEWSNYF